MTDPLFTKLHIATLTIALCVMIIFTVWPALDLMISTALTNDQGQFIAVELGYPAKVNSTLKQTLELIAFGSLLYTIWLWAARRLDRAWLYCWTYITLNLVVGPGVIVNLILKAHVGRPRPAHLTQFGGSSTFTPAFQISDQCASNCSFTSGEAALVATLVFVGVSLMWSHLGPRARRFALIGGAGLIVFGSSLRVLLGRHFTSDVTVSVLISALLALALYRLLGIATARDSFAPSELRARFDALLGSVMWWR